MPKCDICDTEHAPGVTLHSGCLAGKWAGETCFPPNKVLLTRIENEVKCMMCMTPLNETALQNWWAGLDEKERNVARPTMEKAKIWFQEISQPPSSKQPFIDENLKAFDPKLNWMGYVPCVTDTCAAILGLSEGCDLVTCPACKKQQNIIKGDKSHTFLVRAFVNDIKKFRAGDTASAWKVFRSQHKEVWDALHFEDLIQRLAKAQASGNDELVEDLSGRVSPEWPGFRTYLKTRFKPREQAKTGTAKSPTLIISKTKKAPAKVERQIVPPERVVRPESRTTPLSTAGKSTSPSGPKVVKPTLHSFKDRLAFWENKSKKPKVVNVSVLKKV